MRRSLKSRKIHYNTLFLYFQIIRAVTPRKRASSASYDTQQVSVFSQTFSRKMSY